MADHRGSEESRRVLEARARGRERLLRQRSWFRPVAVATVAIVIVSTAEGHPPPGSHGTSAWVTFALAVWVATVSAMLSTRGSPAVDVVLIAVMGAAGVAIAALQHRGATEIPASAAVWLAMTRLESRRGLALSVAVTAGLGISLAAGGASSDAVLAAILLCVLLGVMAHSMRQARESQDRAELLVAELQDAREEQAKAAALAERGRIAGELHDVLAHSLSGAAIQLQGARMLADRDGAAAEIRDAIDRSGELVRAGLLDARQAVAALRGGDLPGTRDIAGLVERFAHDTHAQAQLRVEGEPRQLSVDAELAIYRAAQEALTNAARYAPGADVAVHLRYGHQVTALTVSNQGPTGPRPPVVALAGVSGGHGLAGMRERVERLGGHVSAGPCGDAWMVDVELPG